MAVELDTGHHCFAAMPLPSTDTPVPSQTRSSSTASTASTDTVIHHRLHTPLPTDTWLATLPFRHKPGANPELEPKGLQSSSHPPKPTEVVKLPLDQQNQIITRITTFTLKSLTAPQSTITATLDELFLPSHFYCLAFPIGKYHRQRVYEYVDPDRDEFIPDEIENEKFARFRQEQRQYWRTYGTDPYHLREEGSSARDWRVIVVGRDKLSDIYPRLLPTTDRRGMETWFAERNRVKLRGLEAFLYCEVKEEDVTKERGMMALEVLDDPTAEPNYATLVRYLENRSAWAVMENIFRMEVVEQAIDELRVKAEGLMGDGKGMIGKWEALRWFALWGWVGYPLAVWGY